MFPSGRRVPVHPHGPLARILENLEKVAVVAEAEQVLGSAASEAVAKAVYDDIVAGMQAKGY